MLIASSMAATIDHRHGFKPPTWIRRYRLRSFTHPDPSLLDLNCISPASSHNFPRSFSTPCFPSSHANTADETAATDNIACLEIVSARRAHGIHALVVEAAIAMASGAQLVPASSGLGGAYILHNRTGESFAVVKPVDEEPGSFNGSALGLLGLPGSWRSMCAAENAVREAAAYLLDHGGFSGVPPTALIKISHPSFHANGHGPGAPNPRRMASIQRFVPHDFDAGNLGPSRFPIASVHRIGILDVRLLNIDRHAGNILVKKRLCSGGLCGGDANDAAATELVPIDHGLCLPELLDDPYFEWLHWPQAAVPFSDLEADYISSLDAFKDAELLRSELPLLRESSIRILVLCTIFLKHAAGAGLCLADIGGMMTREFSGIEEEPSALEALCKQAEEFLNSSSFTEDDSTKEVGECNNEHQQQFEFDMDSEDGKFSESHVENLLDVPLFITGKSSGGPTLGGDQRKALATLHEEDRHDVDEDWGDDDGSEPKIGVIAKSVSFSVVDFNHECGGRGSGSRCISFKGLSEQQWGVFLERFEWLLPEAFEARKSLGLKQRLGTSCKF